jgi:hypothetical protein
MDTSELRREQRRKAKYLKMLEDSRKRRAQAVLLVGRHGQSEAARRLGVSRQRILQILQQEGLK